MSIYTTVFPSYNSTLDLSKGKILFKLVDQNLNEIDPRIAQVTLFISNKTNSDTLYKKLNTSKCNIYSSTVETTNNSSNTNHNNIINNYYNNYNSISNNRNNNLIENHNYNSTYVNFTCISNLYNDYTNISHDKYQNVESQITVFVNKCINSTNNNRYCFTIDDIDIFLIKNNLYLLIYIDNAWINHENNYPFINDYSSYKIELDTSFYYKYYFSFNEIIYETDKGLIFSNIKKETSFIFDYNFINNNNYRISLPSFRGLYPNALMEIHYTINTNYNIKLRRNYNKLQTYIAECISICLLISKIVEGIVWLFTNGKMYSDIISVRSKYKEENKKRSKRKMLYNTIYNNTHNTKELSNGNNVSLNLHNSVIIDINKNCQGSNHINNNSLITKANVSFNNSLGLFSVNNQNQNSIFEGSLVNKNIKKCYSRDRSKSERRIDKNNEKKKQITLFNSFIYMFTCVKNSSIKYKFMKYCEIVVKSKLSCEELIYKIHELEKIFHSDLIKNTSLNIRPNVHKEFINEDDKSNLIEIKEANEDIKEDIK